MHDPHTSYPYLELEMHFKTYLNNACKNAFFINRFWKCVKIGKFYSNIVTFDSKQSKIIKQIKIKFNQNALNLIFENGKKEINKYFPESGIDIHQLNVFGQKPVLRDLSIGV